MRTDDNENLLEVVRLIPELDDVEIDDLCQYVLSVIQNTYGMLVCIIIHIIFSNDANDVFQLLTFNGVI